MAGAASLLPGPYGSIKEPKLIEHFQGVLPLFNSVGMYMRYKMPQLAEPIQLFHGINSDFELIETAPMLVDEDEGTY